MRHTRWLVVFGSLIGGATFAGQTPPSLLIVNGRVFTGVAAQPWAEAIAITGERITQVGTSAAIKTVAGSGTRVIDAGGRLVIPGINDAHVHLTAQPSATRLEGPSALEHDPTLAEVVQRLKIAVARGRPAVGSSGRSGQR
jgi:predicted amidohydrolase YtcJ